MLTAHASHFTPAQCSHPHAKRFDKTRFTRLYLERTARIMSMAGCSKKVIKVATVALVKNKFRGKLLYHHIVCRFYNNYQWLTIVECMFLLYQPIRNVTYKITPVLCTILLYHLIFYNINHFEPWSAGHATVSQRQWYCTRISIVAGQVKFSGSVLHFNPNSSGWSITHIKTRELSTYSVCSHDEQSFRYDQPTYFFLRFC
jgi:hypothetical protein